MVDEVRVAAHYNKTNLYKNIERGLLKLGVDLGSVDVDDLALADNFHIGGEIATKFISDSLNLKNGKKILDIGCGIGGPARFVAKNIGCTVYGIDLTKNYIETGLKLNALVKLEDRVKLKQGTALSLPYKRSFFDGAYMIHVGMNIEQKDQLMRESYKALKGGSLFAIFDVMKCKDGDIEYPLPWAERREESAVDTLASYENLLGAAGFSVVKIEDKNEFALTFFETIISNMHYGRERALGLHLLMGKNSNKKIMNIYKQVRDKLLSPILVIAKK